MEEYNMKNSEGYMDRVAFLAIEKETLENEIADKMLSHFISGEFDKKIYAKFWNLTCRGKISKYSFRLFSDRVEEYIKENKKQKLLCKTSY